MGNTQRQRKHNIRIIYNTLFVVTLELPTYIDNIVYMLSMLVMDTCRYEVGPPRLFRTILVHVFVVLCNDFCSGASICTLENTI